VASDYVAGDACSGEQIGALARIQAHGFASRRSSGIRSRVAGDPASDGAAIERLLAKHDLSLPERTALVRMFHLPTNDRRTELMIIYGEALPQNSEIPVRDGGVELDTESAAFSPAFLDHARRGLVVRAQ